MPLSNILLPLLAILGCGLCPSALAADPSPVGHYVLTGMQEVGSQLRLSPEGRFEYMLAYGAYDEYASGTWQLKGRQVVLNTDGEAVPAKFVLKESGHDPEPVIRVQVVNASGQGLAGIDIIIDPDGSGGQEGYTQTYGYSLSVGKPAAPKLVALGVKMYQVAWQAFTDLPATHNRYVFVFEPGTLGKAQFRDLAFDWDGESLTVVREQQRMRYQKR